ncbi:MAG: YbjN domain-containing protein [Magnetospirillum sp. WYHS-4]
MGSTSQIHNHSQNHPLDIVEQLVASRDWLFDRNSDHEMAVRVPGRWCDHNLYFAWNDIMEAVQFTCAFDMRVPEPRRAAVNELLALINERLWIGHFGLWMDEGQPLYRHVLPLRGLQAPSVEQIEDLVETAIEECERFFPAFQFVVWAGKSPADALESAMVDTVGEA